MIPWKESDKDKFLIKTKEDIPNMMSKMRIYFSQARVKSDGGIVNSDCYVQHSVPIIDLKEDAEWFLKQNKMGVYNKQLQVEAIEQKG